LLPWEKVLKVVVLHSALSRTILSFWPYWLAHAGGVRSTPNIIVRDYLALVGATLSDVTPYAWVRVAVERSGKVFALKGRLPWVSVSTYIQAGSFGSDRVQSTGWLHPRVSSKAGPARKKGPECLRVTECKRARAPGARGP
jgi:hypothetical protein